MHPGQSLQHAAILLWDQPPPPPGLTGRRVVMSTYCSVTFMRWLFRASNVILTVSLDPKLMEPSHLFGVWVLVG